MAQLFYLKLEKKANFSKSAAYRFLYMMFCKKVYHSIKKQSFLLFLCKEAK